MFLGDWMIFHLDIPFLSIKSFVKFDTLDDDCSPTFGLLGHDSVVSKMNHIHSQRSQLSPVRFIIFISTSPPSLSLSLSCFRSLLLFIIYSILMLLSKNIF